MSFDVVRRFVPHHKSQLICIAGVTDQTDREGNDGPPVLIKGLKRIRGLVGTIVNDDLEIAVRSAGPPATLTFGDGFNHACDLRKGTRGLRAVPEWLINQRILRISSRSWLRDNGLVASRNQEESTNDKYDSDHEHT